MLRTFWVTCAVLAVCASVAVAQVVQPAPNPNQGAFDKLSPGNQKIAQALFNAEQSSATSTTTAPLSRDDIAAMKQDGKGWGEIFKEMRKEGLVQQKNLGQVVSQNNRDIRQDRRDIKADKQDINNDREDLRKDLRDLREDRADLRSDGKGLSAQPKSTKRTVITTGSGRSYIAGTKMKPELNRSASAGQSGNNHQPQFTGGRGSLSSEAGAGRSNAGGLGGRGRN